MASGKTDNLMTAILAHGRDPSTGEYLTAAQRKDLFRKSKISGSKVFGGGSGGGGVRGGGGGRGGLAGGALALRQAPGEITNTEISQKLDKILFLIKKDADTEKKYRESLLEKQQRAKEKMLRGSAERGLEGANKEKEKKVDKAKSGMKVQIPFLERLAKFLMIYLTGWVTDKLIKMFSSKAEGNIAKFLEYRDILINQLGKYFTPVANIANGFVIWIAKTTKKIAGWAGRIGQKVFTKLFGMVRKIAIGMLNKIKDIVKNPLQALKNAGKTALEKITAKGADILSKIPGAEATKKLITKAGGTLKGLTQNAGKFVAKLGSKLNPKQLLQKALSPIKGLLGQSSGVLGNGLKKLIKGNLLGMILGAGFDVRERLASGQSPTQAFLAGIIKGAAAGGTAGVITSALTTAIPGLGLPLGLLLGGFLGDKAGSLLSSPIDNWFAEKQREPNDFDKWFTNWANNSDDSMKALLGWDNRTANANAPNPNVKDILGDGAGTGDKTRVSPGAALQNSSSLGPAPSRPAAAVNVVVPSSTGKAAAPTQIPQKSLGTDIPIIESTNFDNPYLAFSYSIYNVLA